MQTLEHKNIKYKKCLFGVYSPRLESILQLLDECIKMMKLSKIKCYRALYNLIEFIKMGHDIQREDIKY